MDQLPDGPASPAEDTGGEETRAGTAGVAPTPAYEPTGVASVDQVLADVAAVAESPVGDHVEVFERAHEQLRRALDAAPATSGGEQGA